MIYEVTHSTTYTYSEPVSLDPHEIRLRPRADGSQRLLRYDARLQPSPVGMAEGLDAEGNAVTQAWFDGPTDTFQVVSAFEVETLRANPYDFLPDPRTSTLPVTYPEDLRPVLAPCLPSRPVHPQVMGLAKAAFDEAEGQTLAFLSALTGRVYRSCGQIFREEGPPHRPEVTMELGQGSCRDLAVLFMEACRGYGVAARFVSGYQEGRPEQEERHLHAWAEAYLPGGGWRGYDPTQGLAVTDRHIPVAAAARPSHATPVAGSFRGSNVTWKLDTRIEIKIQNKEYRSQNTE